MMIAGAVAAAACMVVVACRKPADSLKADLGEAGYAMTAADWLRASRENNASALKKFLAAGFAIETRDDHGDGALHAAAAAGAREAAKFLLDKKLPIDVRGAGERTPLMSAVLGKQPPMVAWLLRQGADPKLKDGEGFNALMLAVRHNQPAALAELAPLCRGDLDSALLLAAMDGHSEVIDALTSYGASVYARMDDGRTPLMLAAQNGHLQAVKILLDSGAGSHAVDEAGHTAANLATAAGHAEIAAMMDREPLASEMAMESPQQVAKSMDDLVDKAARSTAVVGHAEGGGEAVVSKPSPSKPIANETLSATVADDSSAQSQPGLAAPPLIMRHYRQRELPVEVVSATRDSATVVIKGRERREQIVRVGTVIAGSPLTVVKIEQRMRSSKLNLGMPMDVSVVKVRDVASGTTRDWIAGEAVAAHEPMALVEDAATGRRYTAMSGQRFKSADGAEFMVTDVRPNQLVIENTATGVVKTIPLRGPRG